MGEEITLSLKNVSKCYNRYAHPVERLKEIFLPVKSRAKEFWALRDINLEVTRGETLGIIGQNGSGKSTLLQIIAGTLTTTTGEVYVNGRVSALLELGSGFNPEFTGEQNVFFNGQILGLSREEIEAKFDDITAFAQIGDFINQPVKTYSSGMLLRLAFAVVANTEPTILIVDEALAVGDAKFQARCMKRIRQLKEQGVTILFVSHDSSSVKMLCKRAVLMNHGRILETGEPKEVVNHYIALLSSENTEVDEQPTLNNERADNEEITLSESHAVPVLSHDYLPIKEHDDFGKSNLEITRHRHGNKMAIISDAKITNLEEQEITKLETGSIFQIVVLVETKAEISDLVVGISIRNLMGLVMYGTNTYLKSYQLWELKKSQKIKVIFKIPCYLNKGVYTVTVGIHSENGLSYDWIDEVVVFEVNNGDHCDGLIDMKASVKIDFVCLPIVR